MDELSSREFLALAKRVCTARQYEALVLCEQEGLGPGAIARRLGISDAAARHRLMSASRNVARALQGGPAFQADSGVEPLGRLSLLA
jgi:DNA-directed RNA polymerase specialized sigma24 family protein